MEELLFDAPYELEFDDAFLQIVSQIRRLDINVRFSTSQLESIFDAVKDVIEDFTFTNFTHDLPSWQFFDTFEEKMLARTIDMPRLKRFNAEFCLLGSEFSRIQLPAPYQINAPQVTSLSFARFNLIDWVLIESCRSTLESFSVGTGGDKLPDRLQKELFNMPALQELALDLTNDDNRDYRCSASYFFTTFWNAIDEGTTGIKDIKIQDVLLKLKSLTIVDDVTFTFKRVMGLLSLRQKLGLTPIESLTIWYGEFRNKNKFSTVESDNLKAKVPSFTMRGGKEIYETGFFCDVQCNRGFV